MALLAAAAETEGCWTTAQSTAALSDLADAALDAGLEVLLRKAIGKGDVRPGITPKNSGLVIFALGKHGGRELNYSSDIDIVAFFDRGRDALADPDEATKIFSRIVQRLAALMQDRVGDDYVFRTDLRLRPDPGSTPVALSIDAALAYYESRGQNWERAAWIKARPCAGDKRGGRGVPQGAGALCLAQAPRLRHHRRHPGDEAPDQHRQERRRRAGRGPQRQARARRHPRDRVLHPDPAVDRRRPRPLAAGAADLRGAGALAAANWISREAADDLTETYWFLRAVENRLQMLRDEQTHVMPETPEGVAVIARLMSFPSREIFEADYRAALNRVQGYYADLFAEGETLGVEGGDLVFTGSDDDPGTLETLAGMGFQEPAKAIATVRKWHYGGYAATRAAAARAHLTELLPALLDHHCRTGNADEAPSSASTISSAGCRAGVQLFALLRNHDNLRSLLVALMASAPRMAEAVIHRAHVMDGLIDPAFADEVRRRSTLLSKIADFFAEARDYQEVIDRARIIGQEQMFLIAAGLLAGTIDAQRAGEQFTTLAETLLRRLFAAVRTSSRSAMASFPAPRWACSASARWRAAR